MCIYSNHSGSEQRLLSQKDEGKSPIFPSLAKSVT